MQRAATALIVGTVAGNVAGLHMGVEKELANVNAGDYSGVKYSCDPFQLCDLGMHRRCRSSRTGIAAIGPKGSEFLTSTDTL